MEWEPDLAYASGLLVTDGNLLKDKRHILFRSSDMDLIETFKRCLSLSTKPEKTYQNGLSIKTSFQIQFSNASFYKWLESIGLFAAKSYTIGEINIPDNYFIDFIKGHLDGDGNIIAYIDKCNHYKSKTYTHL